MKYVWDSARRKLRVIPAGGNGEGEGGEGAGDGGQGEGNDGGGDSPKTFTQDEVSSIAAREKAQGRAAAENAIAEQLGVPLDEAAEILKQHRDRQEAEKSEAQRAREAADREKAEAEQAKAEAARERHDARVERLLVAAGVDPKMLKRATPSLDLEVGAEDDAIKAEIDALKNDVPAFFGAGSSGGGAPDSTPKGSPPPPKVDNDAFTRGADRAKQFQGGGISYETT